MLSTWGSISKECSPWQSAAHRRDKVEARELVAVQREVSAALCRAPAARRNGHPRAPRTRAAASIPPTRSSTHGRSERRRRPRDQGRRANRAPCVSGCRHADVLIPIAVEALAGTAAFEIRFFHRDGEHVSKLAFQNFSAPNRTDPREVSQVFDGSGVVRMGATGSDPAPKREMGEADSNAGKLPRKPSSPAEPAPQ